MIATFQQLNITRNTQTVTFDTAVSATTATLTLAENAASIAFDVSISATTQTLTLTEQNATATNDISITATSQAMTLIEQAARIGPVRSTTDELTLIEYPVSLEVDIWNKISDVTTIWSDA